MAKKTDNHNLRAKLDLRRHFLRVYHADGARVLDCCQGHGVIWSRLRSEFHVRSYLGLDVKPKPGRLLVDSSRFLAAGGWTENVIDIDTYGEPWKHWNAVIDTIRYATTIFLTIGSVSSGHGSNVSGAERKALGLGDLHIPASFTIKMIRPLSMPYHLFGRLDAGQILEIKESMTEGNARYIGVRIEPGPAKISVGAALERGHRPKHTQPEKEVAHV